MSGIAIKVRLLNFLIAFLVRLREIPAVLASSPSPLLVINDAARGLAQQMVFWGHDVRHPAGNALVHFGLGRTPSPGLTGTSCYAMAWEGGLIELHGAVASWTPPTDGTGSIFCRDRARIDLWQGSLPPIPGRQHGESGSPEARLEAFQPFVRWLVVYEQWAAETLGTEWRMACWRAIRKLPKGKAWLPPAPALKWWKLATDSTPPRAKDLLRIEWNPIPFR